MTSADPRPREPREQPDEQRRVARRYARRIRSGSADSKQLYFPLAQLLCKLGHSRLAERCFALSAENDPSRWARLTALGFLTRAAEDRGDMMAALRWRLKGATESPADVSTFVELSRFAKRVGHHDWAMELGHRRLPDELLATLDLPARGSFRYSASDPHVLGEVAGHSHDLAPALRSLGRPNYAVLRASQWPAESPDVAVYDVSPATLYSDNGVLVTLDGSRHIARRASSPFVELLKLSTPFHSVLAGGESLSRLSGTTWVLLDRFTAPSYCHWMLDWLPRLAVYRRFATAPDHLIIHRLSETFQRETLRTLGINLDRIVEMADRPTLVADRLLVSSSAALDFRHPAQAGSAWALDFLRETFVTAEALGRPARRIFVSRASATKRRLVNEAEVMAILRTKGFESVELERLTVADQVSLFASAEAVVGIHGAGLTNLAFCRRGTKVLEIFSPLYGTATYFIISAALGLDYCCMNGIDPDYERGLRQHPLRSEFGRRDVQLDLELLKEWLRHL